jgi:hypothetical protein
MEEHLNMPAMSGAVCEISRIVGQIASSAREIDGSAHLVRPLPAAWRPDGPQPGTTSRPG